jgi:adenylyltransferase/sulfurtransferase
MSQASWSISPSELKAVLAGPHAPKLLDVREPEEFADSRIEGCVFIPLGELESRSESELSKDDDIVAYCAHGIRSQHAVMLLKSQGFKKVRSLEGGIVAWEELG